MPLSVMNRIEIVSKITDRILLEIKEWQSRPLNLLSPFAFMDSPLWKQVLSQR